MKALKRSPWGKVQSWEVIAPGIAKVGTASHGGFKLSKERNACIQKCARRDSGWYEEDCEWSLVVITLPVFFDEDTVANAMQVARDYFPAEYTAITGLPVDPSESLTLRRARFAEETASRFVVVTAWGSASWVPEGMVGVAARRRSDGAERYFLVPRDEYRLRDGQFVIDEAQHACLNQ